MSGLTTTQDCSVLDGGLPMRCAKVTALFDDLVGILWETATSLHPRPSNFPRHSLQPRWWTDDCFQAMVTRNASWTDYRRSNLSEDYAHFPIHRLHFYRLVQSTRRRFWRCWQDEVGQLRTQDPKPAQAVCHLPNTSHMARCNGVPRSPTTRDHVTDGGRTFSSVNASSTHEDFSADFYLSMTRRFSELIADRPAGDFHAPFSASELSRALNFCHDSSPGRNGLAYRAFQSQLPWWRATCSFHSISCSSGTSVSHVVPSSSTATQSDPDQCRPIALATCAFKIFERLVHGRVAPRICSGLDECQGGLR